MLDVDVGSVIDRYTVEAKLGEGGMAVVYRVRHNQLGSLHALKVLTVSAASIRLRLLQEGRAQASLRHPNVVAVTDIVDLGGAPGLIMEFIDGPSLDHVLLRYRFRIDEAEVFAAGIISGVAAAHRHGMIHRDLKPANVLVANSDNGPIPKVADFGLAKLLGRDDGAAMAQTRSGVAMGTPSYMAPEQIRNAKGVDRRADIFALGCLMYELVTGRRTFPGDDLLTIFGNITEARYFRVREVDPSIPDRLADAIEHALAVNPEHRTPDCETLLREWRGNGPPSQLTIGWSAGLLESVSPAAVPIELRQPKAPGGGITWDSAEPARAEPAPRSPDPSSSQVSLPAEEDLSADAKPPMTGSARPSARTGWLVAGGVGLVSTVAAAAWFAANAFDPSPGSAAQVVDAKLVTSDITPPTAVISATPPAPAGAATGAATADAAPAPPPTDAPPAERARAQPSGTVTAGMAASSASPVPVATAARPAPNPTSSVATTPALSAASPTAAPTAAPAVATEPAQSAVPNSTLAIVTLKGDAKRVWLESSAGRFPVGEVPPGTYRVTAFFDSGEPVTAGEITVAAGDNRTLRCSGDLLVCR